MNDTSHALRWHQKSCLRTGRAKVYMLHAPSRTCRLKKVMRRTIHGRTLRNDALPALLHRIFIRLSWVSKKRRKSTRFCWDALLLHLSCMSRHTFLCAENYFRSIWFLKGIHTTQLYADNGGLPFFFLLKTHPISKGPIVYVSQAQ